MWTFVADGRNCTGAILALSAKALVTISYAVDSATVILNERGRNLLSKERCNA